MKKYIAVSLLLLLTISLAAFAGGKGKGAVKADLVQYDPFFLDVGDVIFNTNADDQLIITSHINKGLPNGVFNIWLYVAGSGLVLSAPYMNLDEDGCGSGQIIWNIPPELTDSEWINVWVYVFSWVPTYRVYTSGWRWVPLKN